MLTGKVIVVTGGEGLLGRAMIQGIQSRGGIAISADIQHSEPLASGADAFIQLDITSTESIQEAIQQVTQTYNRLDGWVNNAYPRTSAWGKADFLGESSDDWAANVDMHLNGYVQCCRLVAQAMQAFGTGSIVNLASIYGMAAPDFTVYEGTNMKFPAAYTAIKGGLINFSRYLAAFMGPHGVRVNAISPGGIFDHQPESFVQRYEHKVPLKRMASPADIAPPVCFLLSDESAYVTGHNLVVDGGWSVV